MNIWMISLVVASVGFVLCLVFEMGRIDRRILKSEVTEEEAWWGNADSEEIKI